MQFPHLTRKMVVDAKLVSRLGHSISLESWQADGEQWFIKTILIIYSADKILPVTDSPDRELASYYRSPSYCGGARQSVSSKSYSIKGLRVTNVVNEKRTKQ